MTVSAVYQALEREVCCGSCASTVRAILDETPIHKRAARECGTCPVRQQIEAAKARASRGDELLVFA